MYLSCSIKNPPALKSGGLLKFRARGGGLGKFSRFWPGPHSIKNVKSVIRDPGQLLFGRISSAVTCCYYQLLAPCQWGSHPDSHPHKLMLNYSMIVGELSCRHMFLSMLHVTPLCKATSHIDDKITKVFQTIVWYLYIIHLIHIWGHFRLVRMYS